MAHASLLRRNAAAGPNCIGGIGADGAAVLLGDFFAERRNWASSIKWGDDEDICRMAYCDEPASAQAQAADRPTCLSDAEFSDVIC